MSLVPSGRDRVTSMVTVCPGDTARDGRTILAADLGSLGGPEALAGAESTVSVRTGNWDGNTGKLRRAFKMRVEREYQSTQSQLRLQTT